MSSFDIEISEKELAGAEHISRVSREIIHAFIQKCKNEKITKRDLANILNVDKSVVSRMLRGDANLTLRTVGELCWALDLNPVFKVNEHKAKVGCNHVSEKWTVGTNHPKSVKPEMTFIRVSA